jgi:hypothetical protein
MQVSDLLSSIGLNIPGMIFLSLAVSCAILSSVMIYQEIGEVNRKLPDDQQIPYTLMYPGKMAKIKADYKRLYPTGKAEFWRFALQIAAFVFLGLVALVSGFLRS